MTCKIKYDKQVLIQEQRMETTRIIKTTSEKGKKSIRKLDTLVARFIVTKRETGR